MFRGHFYALWLSVAAVEQHRLVSQGIGVTDPVWDQTEALRQLEKHVNKWVARWMCFRGEATPVSIDILALSRLATLCSAHMTACQRGSPVTDKDLRCNRRGLEPALTTWRVLNWVGVEAELVMSRLELRFGNQTQKKRGGKEEAQWHVRGLCSADVRLAVL